jgi:hypothetical protein
MTEPDQVAAAKAETTDEQKEITFRGIDLKMPAKLPLSTSFDLAAAEGQDDPFSILRVLASILGPGQVSQIKAKLDEEKLVLDEVGVKVLSELIETIFAAYGTTSGEAPASAES